MGKDTPSKSSFCGGHYTGHTLIGRGGHAKRAAKSFKNSLDLMVRIGSTQIIDVQRHQGVVNKALKELTH
jgi:hypothetical protein